jgi:predicted polyphosphate/ATP-dependent NAD kinase
VERQALENREKYSQAAIEFEVQKLRIEASRDVQKELAKAIAEFMSRGNMQIFGSPETMATMMSQYAKGMGIGQLVDGVVDHTDLLKDGRLLELLSKLRSLVGSSPPPPPAATDSS